MSLPPPRSLVDALALTEDGAGRVTGASGEVPGQHTFGGILVGQALAAAHRTVEDRRPAHSLHASFVRPGTTDEPIGYEVERTNDGARFATRRVLARQSYGVVLVLTADFQVDEEGPEHEPAYGRALVPPAPEQLPMGRYASAHFESRDVTAGMPGAPVHARAAWFRARLEVDDDPAHHQHALAMLTDHGPTRAVREPHVDALDVERRQSFSLDHAVWFHRPVRVDQWLFYELVPVVTTGGRGLALGSVRTADGTLVATTAQEALLRIPS